MAVPSKRVCVFAAVLVVMFVGVLATVQNDGISGVTRYIHAHLYRVKPSNSWISEMAVICFLFLWDVCCSTYKFRNRASPVLLCSFSLFFSGEFDSLCFWFSNQNFNCINWFSCSFQDYFRSVLEFLKKISFQLEVRISFSCTWIFQDFKGFVHLVNYLLATPLIASVPLHLLFISLSPQEVAREVTWLLMSYTQGERVEFPF